MTCLTREEFVWKNPGEGTSVRLLDRWTPENQDTDVPAFIDEKTREEANLTSTVAIGSVTKELNAGLKMHPISG